MNNNEVKYVCRLEIRLAEKHYTILQEHAKHKKISPSKLIRKLIEGLDNNEAHMLEEIQYHEYVISQLQNKIEAAKHNNEVVKSTVEYGKAAMDEKKKREQELNNKKEDYYQKEIWEKIIESDRMLLMQNELKDKKEIEKVRKSVIQIFREKYQNCDLDIKQSLKQLIMNRCERYFNFKIESGDLE
jgi:predicted DNA-binding ribbon-helix-helix protein